MRDPSTAWHSIVMVSPAPQHDDASITGSITLCSLLVLGPTQAMFHELADTKGVLTQADFAARVLHAEGPEDRVARQFGSTVEKCCSSHPSMWLV